MYNDAFFLNPEIGPLPHFPLVSGYFLNDFVHVTLFHKQARGLVNVAITVLTR